MNTNKIIQEIRFITDYPEMVFTDDDIQDGIEFTKGEIKALLHDPDFDEWELFNAEKALVWGTAYFLKVKTGEIGGFPLSIGDVDMSLLRQRGEVDPDLISWYENFMDHFYRIDGAPKGFGHGMLERDDRQYDADRRSEL